MLPLFYRCIIPIQVFMLPLFYRYIIPIRVFMLPLFYRYIIPIQVFMLFMFLWIMNFLVALSQMTLAGAFASYYWAFKKPDDIPAMPLLWSFYRSIRSVAISSSSSSLPLPRHHHHHHHHHHHSSSPPTTRPSRNQTTFPPCPALVLLP